MLRVVVTSIVGVTVVQVVVTGSEGLVTGFVDVTLGFGVVVVITGFFVCSLFDVLLVVLGTGDVVVV